MYFDIVTRQLITSAKLRDEWGPEVDLGDFEKKYMHTTSAEWKKTISRTFSKPEKRMRQGIK